MEFGESNLFGEVDVSESVLQFDSTFDLLNEQMNSSLFPDDDSLPDVDQNSDYIQPTTVDFYDYPSNFLSNKFVEDRITQRKTRLDTLDSSLNDLDPDYFQDGTIFLDPELFEDLTKYCKTVNCKEVQSCGFCHRFQNPISPMTFKNLDDSDYVHSRRFGDKQFLKNIEKIVCELCYTYLQKTTHVNNINSQTFAWPALLYTFITDERYISIAAPILKFLDANIKKQFLMAKVLPNSVPN